MLVKVSCVIPEENSISKVVEGWSRERIVKFLGLVMDRKNMILE